MSDTPTGDPKSHGEPHDSEAPTQLWQSPFRHLSQFPGRRAARHRERLEALLKGQDITHTGAFTATGLTHTAATTDVSPSPRAEGVADVPPRPDYVPDVPPPPESIPTGTYTSIRPVSGPRLAVFIAVGVAVGGLAALQLNRVLTPRESVNPKPTIASVAPAVLITPARTVTAPPPEPPPATRAANAFEAEGCELAEPTLAAAAPLPAPLVMTRPMARATKASLAGTAEPEAPRAASDMTSALVNTVPTDPTSCSRYPSIHIPTQLHPRINPLMTSNQVFTEQGSAKSTPQDTRP